MSSVVYELCEINMLKVHSLTHWGSLTFAAAWGIHLKSRPHVCDFAPCVAEDADFAHEVCKVLDIRQPLHNSNS
jgi:hypothetical protein